MVEIYMFKYEMRKGGSELNNFCWIHYTNSFLFEIKYCSISDLEMHTTTIRKVNTFILGL
jgi:hypothetical protein